MYDKTAKRKEERIQKKIKRESKKAREAAMAPTDARRAGQKEPLSLLNSTRHSDFIQGAMNDGLAVPSRGRDHFTMPSFGAAHLDVELH